MASEPSKRRLGRFIKETFLGGGSGAADQARLLRLLEINKALVSERQPRRLLELILDAAIELTGAERGFVILRRKGEESIEAARTLDREDVKSARKKISRTLATRVMDTGQAIVTEDAIGDSDLSQYASIMDLKLRSVICTPLRAGVTTIGCLYLDNRFQKGTFDAGARRLLELFSDQAAIAVENARLHDENERAREELDRLNRQLQEQVRDQAEELQQIRETLDQERETLRLKYDYSSIVGDSDAMRQVFRLMDTVTDTDYPVLILGESGTGKELVARAIHYNGKRAQARFVSENCAAIAESLLESELFGYVRGAFTGAVEDKKGVFEVADGGTLFLDEIGEMDLRMQKKLLRVLQEGEFRKVGGRETIKVNVRIISATNADPQRLIAEGRFRDDLYYRLKVMTIRVPPLRERREDIPRLVQHFLDKIAQRTGSRPIEILPEALRVLVAHDWPGNVRELENELMRLAALSRGSIDARLVSGLAERPLPHRPLPQGAAGYLELEGKSLAEIERETILHALRRAGGKRARAAEVLGIPRRTFYNRLRKHGLV
ncbi:MAG: sigma-54-dependent Fis family transcriptional regulator [Planctomycetota bacterium]